MLCFCDHNMKEAMWLYEDNRITCYGAGKPKCNAPPRMSAQSLRRLRRLLTLKRLTCFPNKICYSFGKRTNFLRKRRPLTARWPKKKKKLLQKKLITPWWLDVVYFLNLHPLRVNGENTDQNKNSQYTVDAIQQDEMRMRMSAG